MRQFRYTLIGMVLSGALFATAFIWELDLFERLTHILELFEQYDIDEIILPVLLFIPFVISDLIRRQIDMRVKHDTAIEHERTTIYKAMVQAAQHVLNNFINKMQVFKITADKTPEFDKELLSQYEQVIAAAALQVKALSTISNIDERSISESVAPRSRGQRST